MTCQLILYYSICG